MYDPKQFLGKRVYNDSELELLRTTVTCKTLTEAERYSIMEQAVAPCPEITMIIKGQKVRALLDMGSQVTLMNESYFLQNIQQLLPTGDKDHLNAHKLFNLKGVEDGCVPLTKYFSVDIQVGGRLVHDIGILVKKDNIPLTDSKGRSTRTPAILGCNLIHKGLEEFIRDHGETSLELFECPVGVDPLYFSTLCVYFYAERQKVIDQAKEMVKRDVSVNSTGVGDGQQGSRPSASTNESTQPNQTNQPKQPKPNTSGSSKKNPKSKSQYLGGYTGKVLVGSRHQPICIPARSCKFLVGTAKGVPHKGNFMMEGTQDGNLPSGVAVNNTYVQPTKSGRITVCLQNTDDHNVWIRQPLYAGDLWDVDKEDWEYEPVLVKDAETNNITVKFQQVPPEHIREEIFSQAAEMFGPDKTDKDKETETKEKEKESDPQPTSEDSANQEQPKFGPRPDTSSADFDFKSELDRLPFTINIGEAPLSREQQSHLIDLIYDNKEVFSLYDGDLGFCDALKHSIPTTTDKPVYLPHRQIPVQLQQEVRKCLESWLKQGIIRPSKSPYASQVVIVRKKSGEIRLCVDFRKLNAISIRDSFPLPRIEEALQAVQAAVWFTSFDLAQGYLQMAMEEADIPKTAFRAGSSGLFEFTRMPFGLTNAGASFCRLMEMVIGDQQFVTLLFYLDDICIFANSADQMLDRIELVFSRLKQYQLKIKPKKSFFFQTEVSFLGHVLSAKGISPNPEKVDKVRDWPIPKTSKEVHSFIGLASYYRRFIPNFAKWSKPLNALIVPPAHQAKVRRGEMKKSELTEFVWSKECQEGFDALKHALTTAPVLAYPDYTQPFILETDASLKGLGAVLSQKGKDGEVRVIAYASRSLRPSERSMRDYSSAKIELMALKWSVCEKFKDYLLGSKFTVFTDNNPLVYVKTSKLGAAQIRWLSELAVYDFDIVYRTGRSNLVADALSRRPEVEGENHNQTGSDNDDEEWQAISYSTICEELEGVLGGVKVGRALKERIQVVQSAEDDIYGSCKIEVVTGMVDVFNQVPSTTMAEHQAKDNQLAPVLEWVREGKSPTKAAIYQVRSKNTRQLMYQFHRLILKDGVLHRLYIHNDVEYHQLVLPQRYHKKVLQSLHNDLGHQGIDRTLDLLRERVYWPTMTQDANLWVDQCRRCQVAKGDYNTPKPKFGHLIAHNPLDLVCLDFTKVDPSKGGKENVLVMTDAFTKFSVAVTTNNQQALTVAKALVERWFHVYGIPSRIHSDQGKSFDNKIVDALCKMYGP